MRKSIQEDIPWDHVAEQGRRPVRICRYLHVQQSFQTLLIELQLLLPPPGVELLQPPQLLLAPFLLLLSGQRAAEELAGEWELHLVDVVFIIVRALPFLQFFKEITLKVIKYSNTTSREMRKSMPGF